MCLLIQFCVLSLWYQAFNHYQVSLIVCNHYNVKIILHFLLTEFILYWICYSCIVWLDLWCLALLSTIFQLYRGGRFHRWRKSEYPRKPPTVSLWQTLSHNAVHLGMGVVRTHSISCIGTPLYAETKMLWRDKYRNS